MQTSASPIARSAQAMVSQAAGSLAPGERRVLNENELAQRWGLSPKTLQRWRNEGRGPRYLKLSKRVSYPVETVIEFERAALHGSTSGRAA
jgi:predicted DNA-binding transcriptional regulator AlpA